MKYFLAAGSLYTTNTTEACKIGPSFAPGVIFRGWIKKFGKSKICI